MLDRFEPPLPELDSDGVTVAGARRGCDDQSDRNQASPQTRPLCASLGQDPADRRFPHEPHREGLVALSRVWSLLCEPCGRPADPLDRGTIGWCISPCETRALHQCPPPRLSRSGPFPQHLRTTSCGLTTRPRLPAVIGTRIAVHVAAWERKGARLNESNTNSSVGTVRTRSSRGIRNEQPSRPRLASTASGRGRGILRAEVHFRTVRFLRCWPARTVRPNRLSAWLRAEVRSPDAIGTRVVGFSPRDVTTGDG